MTRIERMAAIGAMAGYSGTTAARFLTDRVFLPTDDVETAGRKLREHKRKLAWAGAADRVRNRERVLRVFAQVKGDRGTMREAERRCKRLGLTIDKETRGMWGGI